MPNANDKLIMGSAFVIGNIKLMACHKIFISSNWNNGDNVPISLAITDEQASAIFPKDIK